MRSTRNRSSRKVSNHGRLSIALLFSHGFSLAVEYPDQSRLIGSLRDRPSEDRYRRARAHLLEVTRGVDRAFREHDLDVLSMPMDSPIPSISAAAGKYQLPIQSHVPRRRDNIPSSGR